MGVALFDRSAGRGWENEENMKPGNAALLLSALTPDHVVRRMFEPLRQEGVNVVLADSLQQAMQAAVIFLDADHPVAGQRVFWQVAVRQILEMEPDTVIVLVSRLADERLWIEVLSSGAYDLLPKSCGPIETRCVVLSALAKAEKLAHARNQATAPQPWVSPLAFSVTVA
jgi:DNA-binding NtrC family response regulator